MITVSALDDHPVVLDGIARMLEDVAEVELLPFFRDSGSLLEEFSIKQPDVLLLDLILPGTEPQNFAYHLKVTYPATRILVLTNLDHPEMARSLLECSVDGYLLKDCDKYLLVEAIRQVSMGRSFIDPRLKEKFDEPDNKDDKTDLLSGREKIILSLIAEEYTNSEIAQRIHLSLKRLEAVRRDLYLKLGVTNGAGAVRKAIEMGLIKTGGK